MAGPESEIDKAWKLLIDGGLKFDPPEPLGHYLGCGQAPKAFSQGEVDKRLEFIRFLIPREGAAPSALKQSDDGKVGDLDSGAAPRVEPPKYKPSSTGIRGLRYDMVKFFEQRIEKYVELTGIDRSSLRGKKAFMFPGINEARIKEDEFEN